MSKQDELRSRVRKYIVEEGISQREFGRRSGYSAVRNWLVSSRTAQRTSITKIEKILARKTVITITPLDRIISHLTKAKKEIDGAKGEIEEVSSYLMAKIADIVRFKNFLKELEGE